MPSHELDAILLQIRTVALELRRLEGDGLDGIGLALRLELAAASRATACRGLRQPLSAFRRSTSCRRAARIIRRSVVTSDS